MRVVKAAAVQLSPVLYSREGTVEKVVRTIHDLGQKRVNVATFPETVVPYYPYFSFVQPPVQNIAFRGVAVGALVGVTAYFAPASAPPDAEIAPIFGVKMPAGYRDWRVISVAHEEGSLNDLRAILGNDVAIRAFREGRRPFPDGAIIARLAWSYGPLEESEKAFGHPQSFVAGPPKNGVQFMVKDSTRYVATAGWGFAQFDRGEPAGEAVHSTCFACHEHSKARDFVFNHYSP